MFKVRPTATDVVAIKRGQILLCRRNIPPHAGSYVLPGGFVKRNESTEEAALREFKEETGYSARIKSLIGVYSDPSRDIRQVISVAYLIEVGSGKLKNSIEGRPAWFDLKKRPKLAFDHEKVLADALKLLKA